MRDMKARHFKRQKHRSVEVDVERVRRDREVTSLYGRAAHAQCGTKRRYETREDAVGCAACRTKHTWEMLRAYHCPYCGGWHLTSH